MGKTKIYLLLVSIPIFYILVTVNLYSQSLSADNTYQEQKADSKAPDILKHKVKAGDSILSLAYMYRSTAADIKKINKISRDDIYIGEVLKVPYNSEGYEGEDRYIMYKVYRGDSLSELALNYKTDIESIKQVNNLDSSQINYGQRIEIPYGLKIDGAGSESEKNVEATVTKNTDSKYKEELAYKYNKFMSIEDKNDAAVPKLRTDNEIVEANRDFSDKQETYNANYWDLENNLKNNLSDRKIIYVSTDNLNPAEENDIPEMTDKVDSGQKQSVESDNINTEVGKSNTGTNHTPVVYIVKSGDNLSSIAEEYHATAAELKEFNKLQANTLQPGQKIMIPKYDFTRYRIKQGDNLSTIASTNNTTVKELKELNDLNSGEVYIGQRIKIPAAYNQISGSIPIRDTVNSSGGNYNVKKSNASISNSNNDENSVIVKDSAKENIVTDIEEGGVAEIRTNNPSSNENSSIKVNPALPVKSESGKAEDSIIASDSRDSDKLSPLKSVYVNKSDLKTTHAGNGNEHRPGESSVNSDDINNKSIAEPKLKKNTNNISYITNEELNYSNAKEYKNAGLHAVVVDSAVTEQENSAKNKQIVSENTASPASEGENPSSYKVERGDNLSMLAEKFDTSVREIKLVNNLENNQIRIGKKLFIPSAGEAALPDINNNDVTISPKSDNSDLGSEVNTEKSVDNEIQDANVENEISEMVKKSESETNGDKIKQEIKNLSVRKTGKDIKIDEIPDSGEAKLSEDVTGTSENKENPVQLVSLENEVAEQKSTDKVQNNVMEKNKPEHNKFTVTLRNNNKEVEIPKDKFSGTDNKSSEIAANKDTTKQDAQISDAKTVNIENADISKDVAEVPLNKSSNVSKNSVKNNISDLEYKSDYGSELNNKVALAQLLTIEENSVPSEEDRYHTLVDEQVLLAKNDTIDNYVQNTATSPIPVETSESGEEIVNFPGEIDLRDLVQTMSEITNESFIVDDKLQSKKVTIITPKGGFSKNNAIRLFEAILDLNGFTVYRNGAVNVVTEKRDIKSVPLPIQEGRAIGSLSERYVTQIVPLKNIKAQDVANALKPLISREGDIVVYEPLNTIIIVETKTNLNKILTILKNIDKEKEIVFVKIYNSDAADISAMLTEIFGGASASPISSAEQGEAATRRREATRRATRTQQASSSGSEVEITGFKIITDERTNSLIVIAYPEDIPKIKSAIERLDVMVEEPEHGIYLIRLKNADAEQVVNVLNSLITGTPLTSTTTTTDQTALPSSRSVQTTTQTASGNISAFEIADVRITADTSTNSVIIVGSRREYEAIKRVVDEIDIRRKQVYVEAAILEVALDQLKSLGANLSFGFTFNEDNLGFGGSNLPGVPSLLGAAVDPENSVNLVGSLSGMFLGVIGEEVDPDGSGPIPPIPSFTALFQALTSITDVNILSTPSIVTTDNEEAQIVVADVIPFPTGSTVGDSGVTVQTIDREPVGITLAITPQIGDGDYLNLQLQTEVSSIRPSPPDLNTEEFGIATATRTATSTVVVKNGQTIVIGGLVQDRESTLENKVPALGNVPILGNLFKYKQRSNNKINLMILLTPRIIDDEKDMRLILEDRQKRNMLLQEKNIDEERLLLE